MRESGIQRRAQNRDPGDDADRAGGGDVLREVRELKDRAAEVVERVAGGARAAKEQVMQKAAEVTRAVADGVREEAERLFDEQKGRVGSKVGRWGKTIHQSAHALRAVKADGVADVVDQAADRVEGLSSYLDERGLGDVLSDAEDLARRHTGLVVGGLFLTGLLAARFVKASAARGAAGATSGGGNSSGGARRGR